MPKMKTHKGVKKRVTVSAGRKVMRSSSFAGHLMSGKPGRRRQRLRRAKPVLTQIAYKYLRALGEL